MTYKQISSKILIGTVFERFNIDYSGFISRVPNWIHFAMREMDIYTSLLDVVVEVAVVDYKAAIPSATKKIVAVSYLGDRLPRTDTINQKTDDDMADITHTYESYEVNNNGYIITTFESCDAEDLKFYIKTLPIELDTTTKLYFPLIPDSVELITALEWYILKRIVERGHKVRDFTIDSNNEFKNPALAWEIHKKRAINSVDRFDLDERHEISNQIRTFLDDYTFYGYDNFNNKNAG